MKQRLWIAFAACLAYCVDKELCKAIDYLREQVFLSGGRRTGVGLLDS